MAPHPEWRLDPCPADLDAHFPSHGSVSAALAWVELVLSDRLAAAWPSTGPAFRLALTRHWAWRNRAQLSAAGHDPLLVAAALADDDGATHPLWPAYAAAQGAPGSADADSSTGWVAAAPPEPVGPDLELVELLPPELAGTGRRGPGLTLLLRLGPSGWLVDGHGRMPLRAGWPPCR